MSHKTKALFRKTTSSILAFLIIFQTVAGIFLPVEISLAPPYVKVQETQAAWLSDYSHRAKITVNGVDSGHTGYQMKVKVYSGAGANTTEDAGKTAVIYCNSNSLNWPSDIAFTQTDEATEIYHWRENDVSPVTFWIKVDVPASGNTTDYYIYYGKSGGSTVKNNGGSTFEFFDDFETGSVPDAGKWNTSDAPAVSGGKAVLDNDDTIYSIDTFGYNHITTSFAKADEQDARFIEFRESGGGTADFVSIFNSDSRSNDNFDEFTTYTCNSSTCLVIDDLDGQLDFRSDYYQYEIRRKDGEVKFYQEGNLLGTQTSATYLPTPALSVGASVWDSSQESIMWVDWYLVRQYAATEPTFSAVGEETAASGTTPTGSFNSASQKTDASGKVDISIEVDDPNDDDTKAKIEYVANGSCDFTTPSDPTLDEAGGATADFNDSGGSPSVVNVDTYQVGTTATRRIITSSGSNTVQFDWNTKTDVPSANGTYCLRLTVNDDSEDQATPDTQVLTLDNVLPIVSEAVHLEDTTPNAGANIQVDTAWTETNPNVNEFDYKLGAGAYQGWAAGDSNTADPSPKEFTVTLNGDDYISGIKTRHTDDYGNVSAESENTTNYYVIPYTPSAPTVDNGTSSTVDVTVNKHSSEATGLEYAIQSVKGAVTKWVQANGALGDSAVWQTRANWGTDNKITVTGLVSPVSDYIFKTKSRNSQDNSTESGLSAGSSIHGWLTGWSYRKKITITGQSGAGTDYQVKLTADSNTGSANIGLSNHCTDFPNDIQFTDDDQDTLLDYWIEDASADPITVWVEVRDDLDTNQDIYIYYGKNGESSASDGTNTFQFFDDFSATLNTDYKMIQYAETIGDKHADQSVGYDGTYFYTVGDGLSADETLYKWNSDWTLNTSRDCGSDAPAGRTQLCQGYYHSDGKLYFSGGSYPGSSTWASVYLTDLTADTYYSNADGHGEGIFFHNNHWWIAYYTNNNVSQYDTSWNLVNTHSNIGGVGNAGGVWWLGDYFYYADRGSAVLVYYWNGTGFEFVESQPGFGEQGPCFNAARTMMWCAYSHNDIVMRCDVTDVYEENITKWDKIENGSHKGLGLSGADNTTLTITTTGWGSHNSIASKSFTANSGVAMKARTKFYGYTPIGFGFSGGVGADCAFLQPTGKETEQYKLITSDGVSSSSSSAINMNTTDFHNYEILWTSSEVTLLKGGVEEASLATNLPNDSIEIQLGTPTEDVFGTQTGWFDWVFVRKYIATEPAFSNMGSEETPFIQFILDSSSGAESVTSIQLELSLSGASGQDISVSYVVTGTASSGTDYTLANGAATITAGNTTTTINYPDGAIIINDALDEIDETIIVTISNPTNASLGDNTVYTYTIQDNDDPPTVSFANTPYSHNETGTQTISVSLSSASGKEVSVDYATSDNTATASSDYTATNGTLTWAIGETGEKTFNVAILEDNIDEANETINLTLSSPTNCTISGNNPVVLTITDDDTAGITVNPSSGFTATEAGATDTYTIVLNTEPTNNVVIIITPDTQSTASPTSLTFTSSNWSAAQTVTVTAIDDTIIERDHISTISHVSASDDSNYSDISISDITANITDNDFAGSGLPPSAQNSPAPPSSTSENTESNFNVSINNGDEYTNNSTVTLKLNTGSNTTRMAISNMPDFRNASQISYQKEIEWDLSNGRDEAVPRLYGKDTYIVYAKFYTQYGVASQVVSDSIILKTSQEEISSTEPKDPEEEISAPAMEETPEITVRQKPTSEKIKEIVEEIPEILEPFIPEILKPEKPEEEPEEEKQEEIVTVPEKAPVALSGQWQLLPREPIKKFVLNPLPRGIKSLAEKFPELEETFKQVGINNVGDLGKLQNIELALPGFTEASGLPKTELALLKETKIADLPEKAKKSIPEEVVFVKTGGELIDLTVDLTVTDQGQVQQEFSITASSYLTLVIKPESEAKSVRGYLAFKSRIKNQELGNWENSFPLCKRGLGGFLNWDIGNYVARAFAGTFERNNIHNSQLAIHDSNSIEEKLVLQKFEYTDPDGDGIYTAKIQAPAAEGEYEIITVIEYEDPDLGTRAVKLTTVIDPEGYVYERIKNQELRIKNAVISLFWLNQQTSQYERWLSEKYQQKNPQTTDATGKYSFLVPEGTYYLKVETPGYLAYQSEPFEVKEDKGVHINIELKTKYGWLKGTDWKVIALILIAILLAYNFYRDRKRKLRN